MTGGLGVRVTILFPEYACSIGITTAFKLKLYIELILYLDTCFTAFTSTRTQ
jgi:hypothetical protein